MQIDEETLNYLKCDECKCYLSRAPIYINLDGSYICGRCPKPKDQFVRVNAYEKLAERMKFPCQYQENGCIKLIPYKDVKEHEEKCDYRTIICPILPSRTCDWLGYRKDLLQHCKIEHFDHVVRNPCTLKHDIKIDSTTNYLTDELFLIHTKVCVSERKIYYCVRFIGGEETVNKCDFNVDIERNGEKLTKKGHVNSSGCMAIKKELSLAININSLIEFLGGYDGTTFTVAINYFERDRNVEKLLKLNYNSGDVFSCPKDFSLVVCVGEDMRTNANITKYFRAKFGNIAYLLSQNQKTGGLAVLEDKKRYIYYLITVELPPKISTLDKVRLSLEKLKEHCLENHVKKLAISKLSFEFDWNEIRTIFEQLFQNIDTEIEVYETFQVHRRRHETSSVIHVETKFDDIELENDNVSLFFVSNDLLERMVAQASTGQKLEQFDMLGTSSESYLSFRRKDKYAQVDYYAVEESLKHLQKLIKKNKKKIIVLEWFRDETDPVLMEKLISLMQYTLRDVEIWICPETKQ